MDETVLSGESRDIVSDNVSKLKEIFPEVITEDKIDFEKLKLILGEDIETDSERYAFTWPGKTQAIKESQKQSTGTLRPCKEESKNWDTTENLYIEGDNLEVLKLLQKSYYGKIKAIYIDPPYNTGKDFIYKDNYKDNLENYLKISGQVDESDLNSTHTKGIKVSTNTETQGRYHSNWLNMMYPRLKLARNLLKFNGSIFISIGDNEVENLKKMCNEIFGEENFIAQFPWHSRQSIQNDTDISNNHEYVLAYAKNRRNKKRRLKESNIDEWFSEDSFVCMPLPLSKDNFDNPDNDLRGLWKADPFDAPKIRPNLTYVIRNPNNGKEFLPPKGRHWRTEEKKYKKLLEDNRIIFGKNGEGKPQLKVFYNEKKMFGVIDNTWWTSEKCGTATSATKYQKKLFDGFTLFESPKPIKLINKILNLITLPNDSNDIILDFFAGSSSTAQSVIEFNLKEDINHKFIMVQIPEATDEKSEAYKAGFKNICEIGKERIRRAGDKIVEESGNKDLDIGFKVFKLDSSNLEKWDPDYNNLEQTLLTSQDNIKQDRTQEDLIYEIMLKYGIDLTLPIQKHETETNIIYSVGFGTLLICLDNNITKEIASEILKITEDAEISRVVFKDNGFASDSDKTNIKEILKTNNIDEFITI